MAALGGTLFSGGGARQGRGRGRGRGNQATHGGRRVTSRGAWSQLAGDSAGGVATAGRGTRGAARHVRTVGWGPTGSGNGPAEKGVWRVGQPEKK
jgi:hypothetical protein